MVGRSYSISNGRFEIDFSFFSFFFSSTQLFGNFENACLTSLLVSLFAIEVKNNNGGSGYVLVTG